MICCCSSVCQSDTVLLGFLVDIRDHLLTSSKQEASGTVTLLEEAKDRLGNCLSTPQESLLADSVSISRLCRWRMGSYLPIAIDRPYLERVHSPRPDRREVMLIGPVRSQSVAVGVPVGVLIAEHLARVLNSCLWPVRLERGVFLLVDLRPVPHWTRGRPQRGVPRGGIHEAE